MRLPTPILFLCCFKLTVVVAEKNSDVAKYIDYEKEETPTQLTKKDFKAAKELKKSDQQEYKNEEKTGEKFFQGDIAMEKQAEVDIFKGKMFDDETVLHSAVINPVAYWPNGIVPYRISSRFTSDARKIIAAAIADFQARTCLKFVPKSSSKQRDYVYIRPIDGCYSYLGRQGGSQDLSLTNGCFLRGTVIHELLHVVGFIHEQSRPDRDEFVKVLIGNVRSGSQSQFDKLPERLINTLETSYDYRSVMHYGRKFFSKNGQDTIRPLKSGVSIGQREGFSDTDVIRVNRLYNCDVTTTQTPSSTTTKATTTPKGFSMNYVTLTLLTRITRFARKSPGGNF